MIPGLTITFCANQINEKIRYMFSINAFSSIHSFFLLQHWMIDTLILYVINLIPGMYSNIQGEICDVCKNQSTISNETSFQLLPICISLLKQLEGK